MPASSEKNGSKKLPGRFFPGWLYVFFFISLLLFYLGSSQTGEGKETTWQYIETMMIPQKAIAKIEVVNGEKALIYIKKEYTGKQPFADLEKASVGPHYHMNIGSVEAFERKLEEAQKGLPPSDKVYPVYLQTSGWFRDVIGFLLPFSLLFLFWQYVMRKSAAAGDGSIFSFGKSRSALFERDAKTRVTFKDVAGLDEAEMEVKEIVDFLKNPERFTKLGAKIPKGVILVGPPGTGKTLLAKAVAGEADVPFFSMSGSEFVEMFVGVGASRVRDLFRQAKENTPSIVFIDEIDAIGRSRGKSAYFTGSNDERESTLNQLLKEMDGFESNSGVIVLAATNRADMLDPALLRPGRFDRHIYLELPNKKEREAIFEVHLRPLQLEGQPDPGFLASQTPGFSGADIANVCNEAALIAARKDKEYVGREEFLDAIERTVAGIERKTKIITPAEKKIIAYHEGGHAVVSWLMPHVDPLVKVSIIPRGKSLGAAWYLPEERQLRTKTEFREHLCATLGGRAAEEIVFGEPTSGALDDLEKATKEAYMMVAYFGFSDNMGSVSFYDSTGQQDTSLVKPYSEETARLIDDEVRKLLNDAYAHTKEMLQQNRGLLDRLAERLLQKETLYKEDLETVLGKRQTVQEVLQR
ncbi:MAG TPA: ATP-dependent zinc metalloprotease FtsH [Flavisolibacter sp.]|nr:ATP-dependent zinc metalloprotease FtsH [Flavisolibacter sp.]